MINRVMNSGAVKLFFLLVLMLWGLFFSLSWGYQYITLEEIIAYFFEDQEHILLRSVRLGRGISAIFVGMALGVCGLLIQILTKNPIASPTILGINAGATLSMVLAIIFFPQMGLNAIFWWVLLGGFLSGGLVFLVAGVWVTNVSATKLTLCGVSMAILFTSIAQALLAQNQSAFDEVFFFLIGSLSFRDVSAVLELIPFIVALVVVAILLARPIGILAIDENIAKSLGQNINRLKITLFFLSIGLASLAIAISGPIALIGLVSPHIAKKLIGTNYHQMIIASGLIGANLLLASDILSRFILYPKELPVGALTLIFGALFFIYLAKKG